MEIENKRKKLNEKLQQVKDFQWKRDKMLDKIGYQSYLKDMKNITKI